MKIRFLSLSLFLLVWGEAQFIHLPVLSLFLLSLVVFPPFHRVLHQKKILPFALLIDVY
jgi:hypothetical protein